MNDERMERRLRDWLAAEADAIEMPERVRTAAADAREAGRHSAGRRGFAWPRAVLPAVVAGAVLLATTLSLALTGVLPVGRADCSAVSIDGVMSAVAGVPGYRWHMTGTELSAHLVAPRATPPAEPYEYRTADLEFTGVYDAPDGWRIEELTGYDPDLVIPPLTGWLVQHEWDAYLFADGRAWARPRGATHFQPLPLDDVRQTREANELYGLLHGEPFRMGPTATSVQAALSWEVASAADGCRLVATNQDYLDAAASAGIPNATWHLILLVDPATLLPRQATYGYGQDAVTIADGTFSPRSEVELEFTYDYADPPAVTAPVADRFQPVDVQQAIAFAQELGVGSAPAVATYQLGAAQAFLLRGPDAAAALIYVDGRLQQSATVDANVDVWVTLLGSGEPDATTFLFGLVNDARVASVEVFFADGSSLTIPGFSAHPLTVANGEGMGEIVTWTAYDDAGNELQVQPPPP